MFKRWHLKRLTAHNTQWPWLYLSFLIFVLDQLTKFCISAQLAGSSFHSLSVLPCLNFILAYNRGAAFSFLGWGTGWQCWLFIIISLSVSFYFARKLCLGGLNRATACAMAFIIGGALGNSYDRLTLGYVIDFIDFFIGFWHFATFNLADIAVSLGAALWIIGTYRAEHTLVNSPD